MRGGQMRTSDIAVIVMAAVLALPALAQRPGEGQRPGETRQPEKVQREPEQHPNEPGHGPPRANQGRIPQPPPQRTRGTKPEQDRRVPGRVNSTPHVAENHWYGHDKPNDRRYHLDRPFEHGRFERFGPSYRYNILRIDTGLRRFWLPSGAFFEVSVWDWPLAADWCWSCGDDFVVYEDPDHPGWYLLYNIHTGTFVHVLYMGM